MRARLTVAKRARGALVTHSYYIDSTDILTASKSGNLARIGTWDRGALVEFEFGPKVAMAVWETLGEYFGFKGEVLR